MGYIISEKEIEKLSITKRYDPKIIDTPIRRYKGVEFCDFYYAVMITSGELKANHYFLSDRKKNVRIVSSVDDINGKLYDSMHDIIEEINKTVVIN